MDALAELDLDALPSGNAKEVGQGFKRVFDDLARSKSFAKGAAFNLKMLKKIQKAEIPELTGAGQIKAIEFNDSVVINGGAIEMRLTRRDIVLAGGSIESKSYNPANLRSNLVSDMRGKNENGLQMLGNVLEMHEGKTIHIAFEKFDGMDIGNVRATFKSVVETELQTNKDLRGRIAGWYGFDDEEAIDRFVGQIIGGFDTSIGSKILLVE
jgi:hypothetical protein